MADARRTLLIIDDNVSLVMGFARLLERAGYAVQTAFTAAEGLKLAVVHRPDAIVLDFQMPLVNGAGFLYRLRDLPNHRHTPVMLLTGLTVSDELRAELAELGAVVRFKPIQPAEFLAETARLVRAPHLGPTATGRSIAERPESLS